MFERDCDAYKFLAEHTTEEQRKEWGLDLSTMKKTIKPYEKYIYQAGVEGGSFKTLSSSFENYALVREHVFGIKDNV